jgi:hypothetical protein
MPVPAFVNPDTIHRPSTGAIAPTAWGDQLNDDLNNLEAGVVALEALAGVLLGAVSYAPTSTVSYTVAVAGGGFPVVALDTTNLAVTVTVPASGRLLVRLSAVATIGSATSFGMWFGAATTSGVVLGNQQKIGTALSTAVPNRYAASILITGQTPGASVPVYFAAGTQSSGSVVADTGSSSSAPNGPAVMEVWTA